MLSIASSLTLQFSQGVAAANEKSPTESAKLTLHDEHEEPSADFSDDQLANWLADSSEDDWNEKGDSEGADAVHQHQHSKVEHLSAAQMHGEETPSGHETVPMVPPYIYLARKPPISCPPHTLQSSMYLSTTCRVVGAGRQCLTCWVFVHHR